jgi:two-component system, cell cycle sensor histidine kinase and response regulator CckA
MDQGPTRVLTRPRILLVDDDTRTSRLLAHMLREDGFDVEFAKDGASAISRLTRPPMPDILVTDLHMPDVDGIAVTQFARSKEPLLPVVIVTGHPNMAIGMGSSLVPLPVVITKPIEYAKLAEELRKVSSGIVM